MDLGDPQHTPAEERVLAVLAARGRCTHAELREATGLEQRALWQAVVKLRGRNLVTKVEVFEAEP